MFKKILLFAAIMALAAPAMSAPFVHNPDTSGVMWTTTFPYQRNMHWDMTVDPFLSIPLYQGTDDLDLFESDTVYYTGDVVYIPGVGVGIDNIAGVEPLTGTAVFHIDNWERDIPWVKHIWKEIVFEESDPGLITEELVLPVDYVLKNTELVYDDPAYVGPGPIGEPSGHMQDWYYFVKDNPPWEEIVFTFNVPPGGYAYLTFLHVATECVTNCYKEGDPGFYDNTDYHEWGLQPVWDIYAGQTICMNTAPLNHAVFSSVCTGGIDTFCVWGETSGEWAVSGEEIDACWILDWGYLITLEFCVTAPCDVVPCEFDTVYAKVGYCYSCEGGLQCAHDCGDCSDPSLNGRWFSTDTLIFHIVEAPPALYVVQDSLWEIDQGMTAAYIPFGVCNGDPCAPPTDYGYRIEQKGWIPGPGVVEDTVSVLGGTCENVFMILDAGASIVCDYDTLTIYAWNMGESIKDTCVQIVHVREPVDVPLFTAPVVTIMVLAMILAAAVFMRRRAASKA